MKNHLHQIFTAAVGVAAVLSCTGMGESKRSVMEFSAEVEQPKTCLNGKTVEWKAGDRITVFGGEEKSCFSTTDNGASASFLGEMAPHDSYYALYPHDDAASCSEGIFSVNVPAEQKAVPNSFGPGANLTVGRADGKSFAMKNVLGYVKFTTADTYSRILVQAVGGEKISGPATVTFGDAPTVEMGDLAASSIQMIPSSGTGISAGTYYVALAPGYLAGGLKFTFYTSDGKIYENEKAVNIDRITRNVPVAAGTVDSGRILTDPRLSLSAATRTKIYPETSSARIFLDTNCWDADISTSECEFQDYKLTKISYNEYLMTFTPTSQSPEDKKTVKLYLKSDTFGGNVYTTMTQCAPLTLDFSKSSAFSPAYATAAPLELQTTTYTFGGKSYTIKYANNYIGSGKTYMTFKCLDKDVFGRIIFPGISGMKIKEIIFNFRWHSTNNQFQARIENLETGDIVCETWNIKDAGYTEESQFPVTHAFVCEGTEDGVAYAVRGTANKNCLLNWIKIVYE